MKRIIKVTLACIPLVAVPMTSISGISNQNKEALNENNYNKIANQLKSKFNVKNWIKEVHNNEFQNYDNDLKSLHILELTNIQKEFLKQNLQEKYQIRSMSKSNSRIRRAMFAWPGGGDGGGSSEYLALSILHKFNCLLLKNY